MRLLNQHLIRSAVGPFFFGLFVITFLLIIQALYKCVDLLVSKGVPFSVTIKVLILSLGWTLALSVPMSVLIAVLMGVGQLAADNEITAMKASGISLTMILRPLLGFGLVVGLALVAFNHWVLPEANHNLANLLTDIKSSRPMMEIQEQMFTELSDQLTIFVRGKDDRTGRIEDVTIIEKEEPGGISPRLTTATWGRVLTEPGSGTMRLELHDGEIHEMPDPRNPQNYQVIRFRQHDIQLADMERGIEDSERQTRGEREMNLTALLAAARTETGHQLDIAGQVATLQSNLANQQWELLTPQSRRELRLSQPANPAEMIARLSATRRRIEQAESQAGAQAKIRESYVRKGNKYLVEFHKKLTIPVACLVFVLLGIPMAVSTGRSGRGVSLTLALVVYVVYYLCLLGGEKIADRGLVNPALAMWYGNIMLTAVGVVLFVRCVRETTFLRRPAWLVYRSPGSAAPGGRA
jgi:lipopolysaccharide export system permease protein